MFRCVICGANSEPVFTAFRPRDRKELNIVDCPICGHRQLFPLLSEEELADEYAEDKTVRSETMPIAPGSDFESMKIKFSEWTKMHADMYWPILQKHKRVLNLGSGYGFFEEELNSRKGKKFEIEGDEIGEFRLQNYQGECVHSINFATEPIPDKMQGKYDLVMASHLLEHLNNPVQYLVNLKELLTEKGKIIMEVPNLNSFLSELSTEYAEFFYLYEHVSYFTEKTLGDTFCRAGYKNIKVYTRELYSIENHINWIRTRKPFIKYNQMFLPNERIEFINKQYKESIEKMGKGFALIAEATL